MENTNKRADFNIDLARFFNDNNTDKGLELIDFVSSVNISCAVKEGGELSIKQAIEHCKFKSKEIGALIYLPERVSEPLSLREEEIEAIVLYQLGAISAFTKAASLNIEHVRPCGLMYQIASQNFDFSVAIAKAVKKFSEWLVLYGASGNIIRETEAAANINIAQEIIINKKYNSNAIMDFSAENIDNSEVLLSRLKHLINNGEVDYAENEFVKMDCDTIHFDVESTNILDFLKEANKILEPRPVNYNKVVASGWVE